jgi:predicted membrane-bound mannosyltransferase
MYAVNVQRFVDGEPYSLVTPSKNPHNPFYSGLVLINELVTRPSFVALRLPAVFAGLLAVGLAYPLLRRRIGRRAALMATVLVACLPPLIAYARFAQDPALIPLGSLLCLSFAMSRRLVALISALAACVRVHRLPRDR